MPNNIQGVHQFGGGSVKRIRASIRLSDKTSRFRVQRHLQAEQFSELIGCPISRSFTTYCVCLELRSLPSTGVTPLPRYYELSDQWNAYQFNENDSHSRSSLAVAMWSAPPRKQ